jgi:hypothetical protein
MGGLVGRVCKSCLHYLDKFPADHAKQRKFSNLGFQDESQKQRQDRMEMMELERSYEK